MVAWSLKCNTWSFLFLDFHEPGDNSIKSIYLMLNTQFLYQQNGQFIVCNTVDKNFNITICKNFIGLQRSIGQLK